MDAFEEPWKCAASGPAPSSNGDPLAGRQSRGLVFTAHGARLLFARAVGGVLCTRMQAEVLNAAKNRRPYEVLEMLKTAGAGEALWDMMLRHTQHEAIQRCQSSRDPNNFRPCH